jgi:hypothetical protein
LQLGHGKLVAFIEKDRAVAFVDEDLWVGLAKGRDEIRLAMNVHRITASTRIEAVDPDHGAAARGGRQMDAAVSRISSRSAINLDFVFSGYPAKTAATPEWVNGLNSVVALGISGD